MIGSGQKPGGIRVFIGVSTRASGKECCAISRSFVRVPRGWSAVRGSHVPPCRGISVVSSDADPVTRRYGSSSAVPLRFPQAAFIAEQKTLTKTSRSTPWRDVVRRREELKTDELSLAQFAADLHEVAQGAGTRRVCEDPAKFFALTFPTHALRELVKDVAHRLDGESDKAVRQLQLTYGGGKTHTLIALHHLFRDPAALPDLPAVREGGPRCGTRGDPAGEGGTGRPASGDAGPREAFPAGTLVRCVAPASRRAGVLRRRPDHRGGRGRTGSGYGAPVRPGHRARCGGACGRRGRGLAGERADLALEGASARGGA